MASQPATARASGLARGDIFAVLFAVAMLNSVALRMETSLAAGPVFALVTLLDVNAALWFSLYAIFRIALADEIREPARPGDKYVAAILLAASLVPVMLASAAALFAAAIYLLRATAPKTPLRKIALVGLAATGPLLWGPICLQIFGPEITRIEALLIGTATGLPTDGNVFRSFDGSATFVVAGGCSSLANISMALLLLVTLTQLLDIPLTKRVVPIAIAAVAATILVNTTRLACLGLSPDHMVYLHTGGGAQLFGWASFILSGAVIGFGLIRVARVPA
jgi:hypothetical protein